MNQHCLAFPASGRFGGALAGEYASDRRIRHSPGSAVAFLKRLADSGSNQWYLVFDVEGNKGAVRRVSDCRQLLASFVKLSTAVSVILVIFISS